MHAHRASGPTTIYRCLALLLLCTVFAFSANSPTRAKAQSLPIVSVLPQSPWVRVGKTIVVDIVAEDVMGLYGAEVHLAFDPQVLQVIDADPAQPGVQLEPGEFPHPDFVVLNSVDNVAGKIDYAATQMPPRDQIDGRGVIARVTFSAQRAATSSIRVDQFLLADTGGKHIEALDQPAEIQVRDYSVPISLAAGGIIALLVLGAIGLAYRKRKREENNAQEN